MKNINIELDDETYWELVRTKAEYQAKSWSGLIKVFLSIINPQGDKNA